MLPEAARNAAGTRNDINFFNLLVRFVCQNTTQPNAPFFRPQGAVFSNPGRNVTTRRAKPLGVKFFSLGLENPGVGLENPKPGSVTPKAGTEKKEESFAHGSLPFATANISIETRTSKSAFPELTI